MQFRLIPYRAFVILAKSQQHRIWWIILWPSSNFIFTIAMNCLPSFIQQQKDVHLLSKLKRNFRLMFFLIYEMRLWGHFGEVHYKHVYSTAISILSHRSWQPSFIHANISQCLQTNSVISFSLLGFWLSVSRR